MADYSLLNFLLIIGLLLTVGWLMILRSNSYYSRNGNKSRIRWIGYALLAMALFLLVIGVIQRIAAETHHPGH